MNPNNEIHEQNGGQPSLSARDVLPVENKNKDHVCRDYIWGKCTKVQCKFVHECDLQIMLNILHFCHDYQNSTGCNRPNCTFIHATREEEKLFREVGQFPSDLVKRHNQMHAALAGMSRKYENKPPPPPLENQQAPPQMLMVNPMYQTAPRWFLQPPPPPPPREPSPLPPHYAGPPPPAPVAAPAYHSHSQPVHPPPAAPSAYSQPILPHTHTIDTSKPPPRLLMQHVKNGSKRLPEVHEGSPPVARTLYTPQPIIPDALSSPDTTKPPPPLFPTVQQGQAILLKRAHPDVFDPCEAGPSKRTRNCQSSSCENCARWELRNLILETKLSEKLAEKACAVLQYEEKKNKIANVVDLLSCLATPQSDASNSVSDISTPLDDTLLRALVANHIKEKPNFVPKQSTSSVFRRITELLKDSDASSSTSTNGNISQGLERLLDLDLDLHRPEPSSQPPAAAPAPHSFPSSVVSTHAPAPTIPPQFSQAYRPMQHHSYQFPGEVGPGNVSAEPMNKPAPTSASMQPAMPPYTDQNAYFMMGRPPPPFQ